MVGVALVQTGAQTARFMKASITSVPGCNTSSTRGWNSPPLTTISILFKVHGSLAHPDAIEEWARSNGVGVCVCRLAGLTGDVRGQWREHYRGR